jgi:putative flippase GtrA
VSFIKKYLQYSVCRYIVAGSISTCIDFSVYRVLLLYTGYINISKLFGLCAGILISYFINKIWTFGIKKYYAKSIIYFIFLYIISNITNIIVNRSILYIIGINKEIYIMFAFCCAAGIAAIMNYIGMKYFVFKKSENV